MSCFQKFTRLLKYLWNYFVGRSLFFSFGWRSIVEKPDMITNPKAISIGKKVIILKGARLEAVGRWDSEKPKIKIGDGMSAGFYFHCGAAESVSIGKDVLIGGRVYITDHDHVLDDAELSALSCGGITSKPVVIEDGVYLGEGCVILKGVTVGKRAVVGANAVVTKDVAPFTVVGGVPARVIKHIYHR
ncbi:MAG: acyltransferase [Planctomycetes bacterium]|nr:acyltransferase [Planctomycetota bacterium]